ncbi:MAG: 6-bladed beta-propeller [Candidatus Margulisiibacteriota bacterium]
MKKTKEFLLTVLFLTAILLISSCSQVPSPETTTSTTTTGTTTTTNIAGSVVGNVVFIIQDVEDSSVISNALVVISPSTASSDAFGNATIMDVIIGNQSFSASKSGYRDYEGVVNVVGGGTVTQEVNMTPSLLAPRNVAISVSGSGQLSLSWEANTEVDIVGYNIYRGISPEVLYKINSYAITQESYADSGLINLVYYYYKITAINTIGAESKYSNMVSEEAVPWISTFSTNESFSDIAVDSLENIYFSSSGGRCIKKFTNSGEFVQQYGSRGEGADQFWMVGGCLVNTYGSVYAADCAHASLGTHNRILVFNNSGSLINSWGETGDGNGQFLHPYELSTDASGNIYVLDNDSYGIPNHNCVQKFDSDGNFVLKFGTEEVQYVGAGIAVDHTGRIYIADYSNHRILRFSNTGTFETQWGSEGNGNGQFGSIASDIAIDSSGYVYVTDPDNSRIQVFDSDGNFINKIGRAGTGNGEFGLPTKIAISSSGNIYILESMTTPVKIHKYGPLF